METVSATLSVDIYADCPNEECGNYINLLREKDTDGVEHDEDSRLLRQVFPSNGASHDDFECDEVTCSECKTTFNVKSLEW